MKLKKSQIKEFIRQAISEVISEYMDDKFVSIGYGRYKEKGKEKNNKDTIGNIVKHIISCNGYKTKDQLIKIWGEVGEGDVNLSPLYKLVKENLVLKNIEWREKEDPPIVQASIQQYISGYKRFKNNLTKKDCKETKKEKGKEDNFIFTKGDKVWWEE